MDEYYMDMAIDEARIACGLGDVPIGCVIVYKDKVIARAHNRKELDNIATYHAEILAINEACSKLGTWHLEDCTLYTTVEPCMMCTGAIIQSRISKVVYGVNNEAFGYLSKLDNSKIYILSGIKSNECGDILSNFFKDRRNN